MAVVVGVDGMEAAEVGSCVRTVPDASIPDPGRVQNSAKRGRTKNPFQASRREPQVVAVSH